MTFLSPARAVLIAFLLISALLVSVGAPVARAQVPGASAPASTEEAPAQPEKDPLGRDTPQGLVAGLIRALGDGDYDRAVRFFETQSIAAGIGSSPASGATLAQEVQSVLDRSGQVTTPAELSADPAGRLDDGLADDLDSIGMLMSPNDGEKQLLARRLERDGRNIWVVSVESLRDIHAMAQAAARGEAPKTLIERFPAGPTVFGAPSSHWIALGVILCLSFALAWVLTAARGLFLQLVRRYHGDGLLIRFVNASAGPIRLLITMIVFIILIRANGLSVLARYYATFAAQLLTWVAIAWLLWRISDAVAELALGRMSRRGKLTAYAAVSFLGRAFKALLLMLFIAGLLRAFGVDVTTGLAALGIGGLAIALGAQKLFENLIGSLMIIADRPVRVGDFCRFGDKLGTVQDIGIRSTRIRTLDRTLLTVPNGEFASLHIENYTHRDRFWFHPTLGLRYETSPEQMRWLLQEIRAMLYAHPKIDPDPARVRFTGLGAYSLDVEIFAYVHAASYDEFLEVQEDLLLRCMEIVETGGSGFAFPSQTLYLGRDGGLDAERTGAAEDAVRSRRESGDLEVPRFSPETIRGLRGRIDYPPPGSSLAREQSF